MQAPPAIAADGCAAGGTRALLLSPTTFMNLSGTSVQEAMSFYKLPNHELLVLCDDLNLPVGKLRFRAGGSSGGQKGLDDIIAKLGTEEFSRLRLGIGAAPDGWDWADYVLSKFRARRASRRSNKPWGWRPTPWPSGPARASSIA